MSWAKLTDDYGDQHAALSDAAFRTHTEGLLWVMRREQGPRFPKRELRRFAETADPDAAVAELVATGRWTDHGDTYEVLAQYADQIEPEVIARRRELDAARQRKARLKRSGIDPETGAVITKSDPGSPSRTDTTHDVTRDIGTDNPRDPGLVWAGQGRTGKDAREEEETAQQSATASASEEAAPWPMTAVPGVRRLCPAPSCGTYLAGIELAWGVCRDHRDKNVA